MFLFPLFYLFFVWLPLLLISFVKGSKLTDYLKKNHKERYIEFTGAKMGTLRYYKIGFLFSEDDFNDPNVTLLKQNCKNWFKFMLVCFIGFILVSIIMELLNEI